jgi:hypothetical protein
MLDIKNKDEIKIIVGTPTDKICDYLSSIRNLELLKYCHEFCNWTCNKAAENMSTKMMVCGIIGHVIMPQKIRIRK